MSLTSIPRTVLDRYLKLVKWPLNRGLDAVGRKKAGPAASAGLAIDRADAAVRGAAATVLNDGDLRAEAERRSAAADARERALNLRLEAELKTQRADEELQERKQAAQEKKKAAARLAAEKRKRAEKAKQDKKQNVAEVERRRRESAAEAQAKREEAIQAKARRDRLETIEQETEALEEREEALVAKDEATRLANAAAAIKEERKAAK